MVKNESDGDFDKLGDVAETETCWKNLTHV